jgi:hypothetical protein
MDVNFNRNTNRVVVKFTISHEITAKYFHNIFLPSFQKVNKNLENAYKLQILPIIKDLTNKRFEPGSDQTKKL